MSERTWTTVHSRYHVIGWLNGLSEILDTAQRREEAMRIARSHARDPEYRIEVLDIMARRGEPLRWFVSAHGASVEERKA